jgi:hypothetical protein
MNTERILLLADFIESLPDERLDMCFWAKDVDGDENLDVSPETVLHNCGTAACIGGWTEALFNPTRLTFRGTSGLWNTTQDGPLDKDSAGTLLGLTVAQAHDLFLPPHTNGNGSWADITPAIAATTLRHLAETGRVEWGHY